jgi:hypothetical protein
MKHKIDIGLYRVTETDNGWDVHFIEKIYSSNSKGESAEWRATFYDYDDAVLYVGLCGKIKS